MLANRTSRWSIGAALLCIALLAASWFLLISPRRADASAVRVQSVQANSAAALLQTQIAELKAQFADLPKAKKELAAIKRQLPPGANIPDFVRKLQALSSQAGVSLNSITPTDPVVLSAPGAPPPVAGVGAPPGSVVSIPLSISVTGDYFEASLFMKNLQTRVERSYLITGFAVTGHTEEEETVTPEATQIATATPSTTATPAPIVPVVPIATPSPVPTNPLTSVSLVISGTVYVLMDGTTTLDDVKRDAEAAGAVGAPAATGAPGPVSTAPAS